MNQFPEIHEFLLCKTPDAWLQVAAKKVDLLLIDHANCEKKAAMMALHLIHRYPVRHELLGKMSRLAREELVHFDKVTKILKKRDMPYVHLSAARYMKEMQKHLRKNDPGRLVDKLILGAIVEARSCERFCALAPLLDDELNQFYASLHEAEQRHFHQYLQLAELYAVTKTQPRIDKFLQIEKELIESPDNQFRFHSGVPVQESVDH